MRHNQILSQDDSVLLVIDFQEKLLAAFKEPESLLQSCIKLIKFARIMKLPIVWTEQYPQGLGQTIGHVRAELQELEPIEKLSFSCFGEAAFANRLALFGRKQLIVCGIETHICVEQTVLDALSAGYQPHVATDACGSRRKNDHKTGLRKIENAGAVMTCVETIIYEILARSDAPEFRQVLRLIK